MYFWLTSDQGSGTEGLMYRHAEIQWKCCLWGWILANSFLSSNPDCKLTWKLEHFRVSMFIIAHRCNVPLKKANKLPNSAHQRFLLNLGQIWHYNMADNGVRALMTKVGFIFISCMSCLFEMPLCGILRHSCCSLCASLGLCVGVTWFDPEPLKYRVVVSMYCSEHRGSISSLKSHREIYTGRDNGSQWNTKKRWKELKRGENGCNNQESSVFPPNRQARDGLVRNNNVFSK